HTRLPEADEADQTAQESVAFVERDDVVDDPTAHEAEIAGIRGNLDVRDLADDAVAERGDKALGPRLTLTGASLRVDDVVSLAPARDKLADQLRRILEVAVDDDGRIAAGRVESG